MNAIGTQLRDPINSGLTRWRTAVINEYMDAAAELGRNPIISKHQIQPEYGDEQADAGRDCRNHLARPNSQARTRTGKYSFSCSADHVQDWQPYPVDSYSCYMCDHTCLCFQPRATSLASKTFSSLRSKLISLYCTCNIFYFRRRLVLIHFLLSYAFFCCM